MKYKIIILLLIISFFLNFTWESFHAYYLYDIYKYDIPYFFLMVYASFVDMILICTIIYFGGILWRDFYWYKDLNIYKYTYIFIIGIIIAIFIEFKGVYILKQWSYSELMPLVFGIGLSPLLQLSFTTILTIYFIKIIK